MRSFIEGRHLQEHHYLFVTRKVARPDSLSILSIGTIEVSSLIYLMLAEADGKIIKLVKQEVSYENIQDNENNEPIGFAYF